MKKPPPMAGASSLLEGWRLIGAHLGFWGFERHYLVFAFCENRPLGCSLRTLFPVANPVNISPLYLDLKNFALLYNALDEIVCV